MNAFRVWTRPLGNGSRVRVEGSQNADWLLGRLSRSFVFKGSEPVRQDEATGCCTFQVPYGSWSSRSAFERLLVGIPEVRLMPDPE